MIVDTYVHEQEAKYDYERWLVAMMDGWGIAGEHTIDLVIGIALLLRTSLQSNVAKIRTTLSKTVQAFWPSRSHGANQTTRMAYFSSKMDDVAVAVSGRYKELEDFNGD